MCIFNYYSKVYRPISIIEDGVHYLKDRTGYIIAKSLVDKEVAKDTKESRTLTVSDKTTLLKNVMILVNVSKLSNVTINDYDIDAPVSEATVTTSSSSYDDEESLEDNVKYAPAVDIVAVVVNNPDDDDEEDGNGEEE